MLLAIVISSAILGYAQTPSVDQAKEKIERRVKETVQAVEHLEKACETCELQAKQEVDKMVAEAAALDPALAAALEEFAAKQLAKLKRLPVVDQAAARAAILATGNSIIEHRFALLRAEALRKVSELTAEELKAIDDAEAAAVTARDNAVKAKDNAKQIEAEKTLSTLSEQRLAIDRALNHPAKSVLVWINKSFDKQVKDAKETFGKLVTLTFDGQKEDLKAKPPVREVKPVEIVTPVMVNHEFQTIVAERKKEANEMDDEANVFNAALDAAKQFRKRREDIADILAARKDETQKNRIRNYLADEIQWAEGANVKAEIEQIIANIAPYSMSWETAADLICSTPTKETKTEVVEHVNAYGTKSKRPVTTTTHLTAQQVIDRALPSNGNHLVK